MKTNTNRLTLTRNKARTNVSVDADLLEEARERGVVLSELVNNALAERLRELRRQEWLGENRSRIDEYNKRIEESGVFSDGIRAF